MNYQRLIFIIAFILMVKLEIHLTIKYFPISIMVWSLLLILLFIMIKLKLKKDCYGK